MTQQYSGGYTVLTDSQGSVIPINLSSPSAVPSDGLLVDVSGVQQGATSQPFGYIKGITIDATAANLGVGSLQFSFPELGITRRINTGSVAVIIIPGRALRFIINNIASAWTTGGIHLTLWNTSPASEVSSNVAVSATGNVTISGTPTVQFAAGQTVGITGTADVSLTGSNTVQFAAGQTVAISGTTDVSLTGANTVQFAAGQSVDIGNSPTVNIGAGNTIGISGTADVSLTGSNTVQFAAGQSVAITGTADVSLTGSNTVQFAAGQTVGITGTANVAITGTPTFDIGSGNSITINAQNITVQVEPPPQQASTAQGIAIAAGSTQIIPAGNNGSLKGAHVSAFFTSTMSFSLAVQFIDGNNNVLLECFAGCGANLYTSQVMIQMTGINIAFANGLSLKQTLNGTPAAGSSLAFCVQT